MQRDHTLVIFTQPIITCRSVSKDTTLLLNGLTVTNSMRTVEHYQIKEAIWETHQWHLCRVELDSKSLKGSDSALFLTHEPAAIHGEDADTVFADILSECEKIREYSAAVPMAIELDSNRKVLVFSDPGGQPINSFFHIRWKYSDIITFAKQYCEKLNIIHAVHGILNPLQPNMILWDEKTQSVNVLNFLFSLLENPKNAEAIAEKDHEYASIYDPPVIEDKQPSSEIFASLYTLGVVLYQLLTTSAQEHDHFENDITKGILNNASKDQNRVAESLWKIQHALMSPEPWLRYSTINAVLEDLEQCKKLLDIEEQQNATPSYFICNYDGPELPKKIYGREQELEDIGKAFIECCSLSKKQLMFLSGPVGVGKSTLAGTLYKKSMDKGAIFAFTKFDESSSKTPYCLIKTTLHALLTTIIDNSNSFEVLQWKNKFATALGVNRGVILEFLPEFTQLFNDAVDIPTLSPKQAQIRLQKTFTKLIQVIATPKHPLILVLDDINWADKESLNLLLNIIKHQDITNMLILSTYRDSILGDKHPFKIFFNQISTDLPDNCRLQSLPISTLALDSVQALVQEELPCNLKQQQALKTLAKEVFNLCSGNPLLVKQFIKDLKDENLLYFDADGLSWNWNIETIKQNFQYRTISELLVTKLNKLSSETKKLLQNFACFGHKIDLDTLIIISESDQDTIFQIMDEALNEGLVTQNGDVYRFAHDRIKEAAINMDLGVTQAKIHLNIGRALMKNWSPEKLEFERFTIINQFNQATPYLTDPSEKSYIRQLNYELGMKAKIATAFSSANYYFLIATDLVTLEDWECDYANVHMLYLELCESEFLIGNHEKANIISDFILGHSQNNLDKAKIFTLRMSIFQILGKLEEAIQAGLEALALFGYQFPENEGELSLLVNQEQAEITHNMQDRTVPGLINLPVLQDREVVTAIGLMVDLGPCLAIIRPRSSLYVLLVFKIINLSLKYGVSPKACFIFSQYGRRLITHAQDVKTGWQFAELAIDFNQKFHDEKSLGVLLFFQGTYLHHWQKPIAEGINTIDRGFELCKKSGNYVFAGHCANFSTQYTFLLGSYLSHVHKSSEKYLTFANETHSEVIHASVLLYDNVASQMETGKLREAEYGEYGNVLIHHTKKEQECFEILRKSHYAPAIAGYHALKQLIKYVYGKYEEAAEYAKLILPDLAPGGLIEVSYVFFDCLTHLALFRSGRSQYEDLHALNRSLKPKIDKIRFAAQCCPENFDCRLLIIEAELAALNRFEQDAEDLYDKAIKSALSQDFNLYAAIACERFAGFYDALAETEKALTLMLNAHQFYKTFGAFGKSKSLESRYPAILDNPGLNQTV
ncbi:hypothetical protein TDB9533_04559 [Thalassocella blandensis]|nr:hypothetical protein TDB9533_04559 [Thalassocella blandensis]